MEKEKVFLTDERRKVLDGTYDKTESTKRTHKSKIKKKAKIALHELIAVAKSDEIDNSDVFEPNDLALLIDALMVPDGGLTPRWTYDGDPQEYREKYKYQIHLHSRLDHTLDGYGTMLHRDYPPNENRTFGDEYDILNE